MNLKNDRRNNTATVERMKRLWRKPLTEHAHPTVSARNGARVVSMVEATRLKGCGRMMLVGKVVGGSYKTMLESEWRIITIDGMSQEEMRKVVPCQICTAMQK